MKASSNCFTNLLKIYGVLLGYNIYVLRMALDIFCLRLRNNKLDRQKYSLLMEMAVI